MMTPRVGRSDRFCAFLVHRKEVNNDLWKEGDGQRDGAGRQSLSSNLIRSGRPTESYCSRKRPEKPSSVSDPAVVHSSACFKELLGPIGGRPTAQKEKD